MKVYFAARYRRRNELRHHVRLFEDRGHVVTSRWLWTTYDGGDATGSSACPPAVRMQHAVEDLDDVLRADALILFAEPQQGGRGGRHVEFGIAIGARKQLVIVGEAENVFHYLPEVIRVPNVECALAFLEGQPQ